MQVATPFNENLDSRITEGVIDNMDDILGAPVLFIPLREDQPGIDHAVLGASKQVAPILLVLCPTMLAPPF